MRLVDADQIAVDESEAYMSAQVQITSDLNWLINFATHSKIQMLIANMPTVDAVPVVRCRSCANFRQGGNGICWCEEYGGLVTPEDYCSRARTDGGKDGDDK